MALVLAILGMVVAGYLTWLYLTGSNFLCTGVGGCEDVQNSPYASVEGVPVPLIGVIGYSMILGSLLLEELRTELRDTVSLTLLGLTAIGTLYSVYLSHLELFVIRAACPYCIASTIIMITLLVIAIYRLVLMMNEEPIA